VWWEGTPIPIGARFGYLSKFARTSADSNSLLLE